MQLPAALARAIETELSGIDSRSLTKAASELSDRYRTSGSPPETELHCRAYLATRLPATYAVIHRVLSELHARLENPDVKTLLDLGAGPATSAWAAFPVFDELESITMVERNSNMRALGRALTQSMDRPGRISWRADDLSSIESPAPHDIVLLSYSIGELSDSAAIRLTRLARGCARVAVIIIEPGTPAGYARVISHRAELIELGSFIEAPCPHESPCPLVQGDWCHFAQRIERSKLHKSVKGASLGYEDEKYSYVIASKVAPAAREARVIRHPQYSPGIVRLELCAPDGLSREIVRRSDKPRYRLARDVSWGESWPQLEKTPSEGN